MIDLSLVVNVALGVALFHMVWTLAKMAVSLAVILWYW